VFFRIDIHNREIAQDETQAKIAVKAVIDGRALYAALAKCNFIGNGYRFMDRPERLFYNSDSSINVFK